MDKKRGIIERLEELGFAQIRAEPISARERRQLVNRESFRKAFERHAGELADIVNRFHRKEISSEEVRAKTRCWLKVIFDECD